MARQAPRMIFLRGKIWYYQFKSKGIRYTGSTGETDRVKAMKVYEEAYAKAQFQSKRAKPVKIDPQLTPASKMFELYLSRKMATRTRTAVASVRSAFDRFLDFFGDVALANLDTFQFEDFREALKQQTTNVKQWDAQKPLARKTINGMLSSIGSVYKYFSLTNPLAGVERVQETKAQVLDQAAMFWTDEQVQKLLKASERYVFEHPLKFLLFTGCRPAELRYLHNNSHHIDSEKNIVRFVDKRKRVRGIRLVDKAELIQAWDSLQTWIKKNKIAPDAPLFPYNENWFKRRFETCTKAAGLPNVICHQLRHQFVKTAFYTWGWDLTLISKWVGHKTNMAYETYSSLLIQKPKEDKASSTGTEIMIPKKIMAPPIGISDETLDFVIHGNIDGTETVTISLEDFRNFARLIGFKTPLMQE